MDELPEKYLEGIRLFNEQEFFECHDVLEELWSETLGDGHLILQGLIQASVGMFHFWNGNLGGARKMYVGARSKLEKYPSPYWQMDLLQFLIDFEHCFQEILEAGEIYPDGVELQDERIPVIRFVDQDGSTTA